MDPRPLLVVGGRAGWASGQPGRRPGGGAGGHPGLESGARHVGGNGYARLRLGIGGRTDTARDITGHVLGTFSAEEQTIFESVLDRATDQVICWIAEGAAAAMNRFNGTVKVPDSKDN